MGACVGAFVRKSMVIGNLWSVIGNIPIDFTDH